MKNIISGTLTGVMMLGVAAQAAAEVPSYTFVEAAVVSGEVEQSQFTDFTQSDSRNVRGGELLGSVQLGNFYIDGSYLKTERNAKASPTDLDIWSVGGGWVSELSDRTTFDLGVLYREDKLRTKNFNDTLNGVGIGFGIRSNIWAGLELSAGGGWLQGDYEGGITAQVGAMYTLFDLVGVTLRYDYIDVDDTDLEFKYQQVAVGARVQF